MDDKELNKIKELKIDVDRTRLLEILDKYGISNKNNLKSDKENFKKFYNTFDLEMYEDINQKKKFIIPYEMAELYCMMMATMKSSPIYDNRKSSFSLQDIIAHNEDIIKYVDYLPIPISDYIKASPEYYNALCFINYMPTVLERMSALLHLTLDVTDVPLQEIFNRLIEGLDDTYESYFWQLARKESVSEYLTNNKEIFKDIFRNDYSISTSKISHSLYALFANLLRKLDRGNWQDGIDSTVKQHLEKWGEKYHGIEDKEERIKDEYLIWLCHQKWHILNKTIKGALSSMFATDDLIKENLKKHNEKYNKESMIHPILLNNNKSTISENYSIHEDLIDRIETEMSLIKQSLQNEIDSYIVRELLFSVKDLNIFTEKFQHPFVRHLSSSISLFIEKLIGANPLEISFTKKLLHSDSLGDTHELLQAYLVSVDDLLCKFDSKYKRYGLLNYVEYILKEIKDIQSCCSEIYVDVFVKIQSQKCDHFNKKEYSDLSDSIGYIAGDKLRQIIKKEYFKKH